MGSAKAADEAGLGRHTTQTNLWLQVTERDVQFAISHPTGAVPAADAGTLKTRTQGKKQLTISNW